MVVVGYNCDGRTSIYSVVSYGEGAVTLLRAKYVSWLNMVEI